MDILCIPPRGEVPRNEHEANKEVCVPRMAASFAVFGTKKIYAPIVVGAFLTNFTLDFLTLINIVINTLWFQTLV